MPVRLPFALLRRLSLLLAVLAVVLVAGVAPSPAEVRHDVAITEVPLDTASDGASDRDTVTRAADGAVEVAADPFALLALHLPGEVTAEVRTRFGDGEWSPWTTVHHLHEEGPDPGSAEAARAAAVQGDGAHATHPVWTGPADRLQVRAVDGVTAVLLDPFGLGRSGWERAWDTASASWQGSPRDVAAAQADAPDIVTRAEWGADESIVNGLPGQSRQLDRVFIHHTVGSNGYSQDQAPGVVRAIQAYHVRDRGWSDIGYNFLVDRFGTVYEGRAGGMDQAVIGAQAGGFNTASTGIALMGTYTSATPSPEVVTAVSELVAWKAGIHHFDPLATGEAVSGGSTRYEAGTVVTLPNVSGHRDVSTTTCPGDGPYGLLQTVRERSREAAGDLIVDHASDVTRTRVIRGDPDVDAVTLQARLDPPGEWSIEVYDPDGLRVHRAEGEGAVASTTWTLDGDGWALGDHLWAVAAAGRVTAFEHVAFEPPVILDAAASTGLALADADGDLTPPVGFGATLWPGAGWVLEVTGPDGQVVHRQEGTGASLDAAWADGVRGPGTHGWRMTAEDAVPVEGDLEVRYDVLDRLADTDDPVAAARLLSAHAFADGEADHVVVARADVFADALAGGPLAGTDGPLLLTDPASLDPAVHAELARVLPPGRPIYVLGGTAAVSQEVADQLATLGHVVRLAGSNRVATAAAIAEVVVERTGADVALVARAGPDDALPWADALAGGAYGAWAGLPLLITDQQGLSPDTAAAIRDLGITETLVLGGQAAIADAVLGDLPDPVRLAGADRSATAAAVATQLWGGVDQVVLASGFGEHAWAWALAAAPVAARAGAPLLLTAPDVLSPATATVLGDLDVGGGLVVGPAGLVADEVSWAASHAIVAR